MNYFPVTEEDELERILEITQLGESAGAGAKLGLDAVPEKFKTPVEVDPIQAEVEKQFSPLSSAETGYNAQSQTNNDVRKAASLPPEQLMELAKQANQTKKTPEVLAETKGNDTKLPGMEAENTLIKAPPTMLSRGVVTPQAQLQEQPMQTQSQRMPLQAQLPSEDYGAQQQDEKQQTEMQAPVSANKNSEPDWEQLLKDAEEQDAAQNLFRGLTQAGRGIVAGLTNQEASQTSVQPGNSADRVRQSMAAAKKYALDKQAADDTRAIKMGQLERDKVTADAYAAQVKGQAEQVKQSALNKAEELKIDAAKQMADAADKAAQTKIEAEYKKALIAQGWSELAAKKKADADMQAYRMSSLDQKDDKAQRKAALEDTKDIPYGEALMPGANPGPTTRAAYMKFTQAYKDLKTKYSDLSRLIKENPKLAYVPGSTANQLMQKQLAAILVVEKDVDTLGALAGPDVKIETQKIGDPDSFVSLATGSALTKLQDSLNQLDKKRSAIREAVGTYELPKEEMDARRAQVSGAQQQKPSGMVKVYLKGTDKFVNKTPENAKAMMEEKPGTYEIRGN